ncbi:MAG: hypothetical protein GY795_23455, partial [Desulfobacterales bacterium]|nr:hypothetical protein [Desulfobacterales bacterium]
MYKNLCPGVARAVSACGGIEMLEQAVRDTRTYTKKKEYIISSEDGFAVSEEEYWEKYYEHPYFSYEWNDGVLEEVPVSDREGFLQYKWFLTLADNFLTVFPEG